ncbi:hypothetical protein PHYSODRAFT_328767 [Phytophthora sojae]|uniref:DUF4485 domain-containing protein n=1 Tax=Phytophthora sojae (strain P6497) TaxID=1094619 RepID=G4Z1Z2_PHYSP|nr:hypothetical protein PHYSODRAFT_328767 [Phytophthora sojae]EGZ20683.1 hypothetical protein PHYSODRAFT_328767 [Phytophthora sojae]|eukprot:XP_009523400.1 hypothetical protein PHYSODRAFT_328767 [Phytophthora sojae]
MGLTTPSNSVEYLHHVLAHVQKLSAQACDEGNANKHLQIRVTHWVRKLRSQPTSNPTWLKSVLEYADVLLQMLLEGVIEEPFTKMPPQGPLAALPRYQNQRVVAVTRKVSKQIQTQEQDDQWEWQRVWKGAFDKMHLQLKQKTEETEALATENRELRSLVAGYTKALEEAERRQRDIEAKHLAEIENLRAVHSLELSNLQAKHRQKLQEVALQNDETLISRRRESFLLRPAASSASQHEVADANADFLQYIDAFYSSTLHLTAQNKA